MSIIAEREGRLAFGHNPIGYDAVRPPYPEAVFAVLREQGGLFPGATTLEIGAGNGLATRRLLALGATRSSTVPLHHPFGASTKAHPELDGTAGRTLLRLNLKH